MSNSSNLLLQEEKSLDKTGFGSEKNEFAQVIVAVSNLGVRAFSYSIPAELKLIAKVGQPVLVSFGTKGLVNGFIVGFTDDIPEGIKIKPLVEIIDEEPFFNGQYLNFLKWTANYYFCSLQTVIETAIPMKYLKQAERTACLTDNPPALTLSKTELSILEYLKTKPVKTTVLQKKTKIPSAKFYSSLRKLQKAGLLTVENFLKEASQKPKMVKYITFKSKDTTKKRYLEILELLELQAETELSEFRKISSVATKTLQKMAQENLVEITEKKIFRNSLDAHNIEKIEPFPELTPEQAQVFDEILKKNKSISADSEPVLIHGVTSSGKTEIYFRLIKETVAKGKNILFLAPEIALATELTSRLARRFGTQNVAIWHSSVTDGERFDVWQKLRQNKIQILAGARSAVFAPLSNIGLIIIDEEHESTYKQSEPAPRYNTAAVAKKLAQINNALIVLGSATPDVAAYYNAKKSGNLYKLQKRFNDAKFAKVIMVDMRQERVNGNLGLFSRTLEFAVKKNLEEKKQTLLLINRRGFSTTTQCLSCAEAIKCPKCSVPMIWHASEELLKCHYCGNNLPFPSQCPQCGSKDLKNSGVGAQKVEAITRKIFPDARIARLDSDSISQKDSSVNILRDFNKGNTDILIGTQMIAKGLDNPNVTIVGAINADSSFNLPDYRSSERGFQLLTQLAGRAGRGGFEGKVYFQTNNPEFYVLNNAKNQDYESFFAAELEARQMFDYPPFAQLIRIVLSCKNQVRAERSSAEIVNMLNKVTKKKELEEEILILGPCACVLEKIRDEYRYQILIKNKHGQKGHLFLMAFFKKIILPNDIKILIDVDPLDIL